MIRRALLSAVVGAGLALAAPAAASTVRCDGPARADATGAAQLLTDCGRLDPALGAGALADRALERLGPSLGVRASQFRVLDASRDPAGRVVRLQQSFGDVPVFDGQIALRTSDGGALRWVRSSAATARPPSLRPAVSGAQALAAADAATGRGDFRLAPTTDLVAYPQGDGSVLAWHVVLPTTAPADWNVIVDANSGQPIASWDAIKETNSASIFDPNPVQTAGTYTGFHDGGDADTAALTANRITGVPTHPPERIGQHAQGRLRRPHGDRDRPERHPALRPGRGALGDPRLRLHPQRRPLRGGERLRRDHRRPEPHSEPGLHGRQQPIDSGRRPLLQRRQLVLLGRRPRSALR